MDNRLIIAAKIGKKVKKQACKASKKIFFLIFALRETKSHCASLLTNNGKNGLRKNIHAG
jgi:hypothetical protein